VDVPVCCCLICRCRQAALAQRSQFSNAIDPKRAMEDAVNGGLAFG